jgi:hypothetical protein
MHVERDVHPVEILGDFCGHIVPGSFPFDCHVALVYVGNRLGLYFDGDIIIGEEAYLRDMARRYTDAVLGSRKEEDDARDGTSRSPICA